MKLRWTCLLLTSDSLPRWGVAVGSWWLHFWKLRMFMMNLELQKRFQQHLWSRSMWHKLKFLRCAWVSYILACAFIQGDMCVYIHLYIYIYIYLCIYKYKYVRVCVYIYIYVYVLDACFAAVSNIFPLDLCGGFASTWRHPNWMRFSSRRMRRPKQFALKPSFLLLSYWSSCMPRSAQRYAFTLILPWLCMQVPVA